MMKAGKLVDEGKGEYELHRSFSTFKLLEFLFYFFSMSNPSGNYLYALSYSTHYG